MKIWGGCTAASSCNLRRCWPGKGSKALNGARGVLCEHMKKHRLLTNCVRRRCFCMATQRSPEEVVENLVLVALLLSALSELTTTNGDKPEEDGQKYGVICGHARGRASSAIPGLFITF